MKVPTGLRTFLSLRDVAQTISDMAKAISLGWSVEHNANGSHKFAWVDLPHDSTRFTGGGTMTWGVTSDDQKLMSYRIVGDACEVQWRIERSNVGGGNNQLRIRLPDGIRPTKRSPGVHYYDDAGTEGVGLARLNAELTEIHLFKNSSASNWTATAADNTWTEGTITFPITQ